MFQFKTSLNDSVSPGTARVTQRNPHSKKIKNVVDICTPCKKGYCYDICNKKLNIQAGGIAGMSEQRKQEEKSRQGREMRGTGKKQDGQCVTERRLVEMD